MNAKQLRALECLLQYPTRKEAAAAAEIDEKTMRRYLQQPEFRQAYRAATDSLISDATRQATQSLNTAIATLRDIAENDAEAGSTRVSAARGLLEYALRLSEFNDVLRILESTEGSGESVL